MSNHGVLDWDIKQDDPFVEYSGIRECLQAFDSKSAVKQYKGREYTIKYWVIGTGKNQNIIYEWPETKELYLKSGSNNRIKRICNNTISDNVGLVDTDSLCSSINSLEVTPDMEAPASLEVIECYQKLLYILKKVKQNREQETVQLDKTLYKENATFKDLQNHILSHPYNTIIDFLYAFRPDVQKYFEPQESLLRLFGLNKCLPLAYNKDYKDSIDLNNYNVSLSNFSNKEVRLNDRANYNEETSNNKLKDSGDKSDLTFVNPSIKEIVATTSKNYNDYNGKGKSFDLNKIQQDFEYYVNTNQFNTLNTLVVVRDKDELFQAIERMAFSSAQSRELLNKSYFLDWHDLNTAYRKYMSANGKTGYNEMDTLSRREQLMCKYINPTYRKALASKGHPVQHYTNRELERKFSTTPDIHYVTVILDKTTINIDQKEKLVKEIMGGGKIRIANSTLIQKVHIRANDGFGHSFKDLFLLDKVFSVNDTNLLKTISIDASHYIFKIFTNQEEAYIYRERIEEYTSAFGTRIFEIDNRVFKVRKVNGILRVQEE